MTRIAAFTPEQARRVWATTLEWETNRSARLEERIFQEAEPILVRNDSAHEIPPYGLMQITGTFDKENSYNYLTVKRPFIYTGVPVLSIPLVNGPNAIPADEFGTAQAGPVFRVVHDAAITYEAGDRVGWLNDSFEVGLGCLFRVLGEDDVATDCLRVVFDQSAEMGQSAEAIAANSSGDVNVRKATSGGFSTVTTKTYTAFNDTSVEIPNNVRIMLWPCNGRFIAIEVC